MEKVIELLKKNLYTITTMESCTGGAIISQITMFAGASSITEGGFVTYSNEAKIRAGVPREVIETYGVYSKETAIEMAKACQRNNFATIGVGVTGSFSNVDPNNQDSKANEVDIAIAFKEEIITKHIVVDPGNRNDQKKYVLKEVEQLLLCLLQEKNQ